MNCHSIPCTACVRRILNRFFFFSISALLISDNLHIVFGILEAYRLSFSYYYPTFMLRIFPYFQFPFYRITLVRFLYRVTLVCWVFQPAFGYCAHPKLLEILLMVVFQLFCYLRTLLSEFASQNKKEHLYNRAFNYSMKQR